MARTKQTPRKSTGEQVASQKRASIAARKDSHRSGGVKKPACDLVVWGEAADRIFRIRCRHEAKRQRRLKENERAARLEEASVEGLSPAERDILLHFTTADIGEDEDDEEETAYRESLDAEHRTAYHQYQTARQRADYRQDHCEGKDDGSYLYTLIRSALHLKLLEGEGHLPHHPWARFLVWLARTFRRDISSVGTPEQSLDFCGARLRLYDEKPPEVDLGNGVPPFCIYDPVRGEAESKRLRACMRRALTPEWRGNALVYYCRIPAEMLPGGVHSTEHLGALMRAGANVLEADNYGFLGSDYLINEPNDAHAFLFLLSEEVAAASTGA